VDYWDKTDNARGQQQWAIIKAAAKEQQERAAREAKEKSDRDAAAVLDSINNQLDEDADEKDAQDVVANNTLDQINSTLDNERPKE
jgi:hypothetical protein